MHDAKEGNGRRPAGVAAGDANRDTGKEKVALLSAVHVESANQVVKLFQVRVFPEKRNSEDSI